MVKLILVHVPKTAGTRLRGLIQQVYGHENVYGDYTNNELRLYYGAKIPMASLRKIKRRQAQVVLGHFDVDKYLTAYPNAFYIIWLRNPISRLVSHYNFWKETLKFGKSCHNPVHTKVVNKKMSFMEFARLPELRNHMSVFAGSLPLADYGFVGITEHFAEDVQFLAQHLGWPEFPQSDLLKSKNHYKPDIPDDWVTELTALHDQDFKLYREAILLREQRIEKRENGLS